MKPNDLEFEDNPPCGRLYRLTVSFCSLLVRIFFRRVEVTGRENIPETGGGVLISWHPNGLIDPGLIVTQFPRPIVFGARHGLFKWPLLGYLMRSMGTVPIYRQEDVADGTAEPDRRAANRKSIDLLAEAVVEGRFAALFPEGLSHDEPYPMELKTGAARLYYRAVELSTEGAPPPVIIPVGIHYNKKGVFGSSALVAFHPPLDLNRELASAPGRDEPEEVVRRKYRTLTAELGRTLHEVVYATDSWMLHHAMHRARKLVRAERAARAGTTLRRPRMSERILGFSRLRTGYNIRVQTHPDETRKLVDDVREYDEDLRALGIEDHELDKGPHMTSPWLNALLVLQAVIVWLVLPTLFVIGIVVNLPTALALTALAKGASKAYKDEASVKVLVGALAFPLTWLTVALLVAWGQTRIHTLYPQVPNAPVITGVLAFVLSALGGIVALIYQRLLSETMRSIRVRLTRARRSGSIHRLRKERSRLYENLMQLSQGLDLPGAVTSNGRVVEATGDCK
jgi:1-acyl-sn-glycerol-3-phosphate acyltransferase